jgi:hypothetical protein
MRAKVATVVFSVFVGIPAALIWVGVSAQQQPPQPQGQKFPGVTNAPITVAGTIDVGNVPAVLANQQGEWRVAVANSPDVRIANTPTVTLSALPFVRLGGRYEITWTTSERETLTILQLGSGGWAKADSGKGRPRWVNLAVARSVDELP